MKTCYFSFGQTHFHSVNGKTFDKDCIVEITSADPRATMFEIFGRQWAMQYDEVPEMQYYPRGIIVL